jgi:hypothetical protein
MSWVSIAGTVLASALALGAAANNAAAAPIAPPPGSILAARDGDPIRQIHFSCRCGRQWPHRHYWQWDHRPVWDDPWAVLKPNFWGSPEPHLVPADIWACKWHLPSARSWRWGQRQCRPWHKVGDVNE